MCVLSDQVIAFWTSPRVPGVSCEDKYFLATGRWGTSSCRGPPLPCEQALSSKVQQVVFSLSLQCGAIERPGFEEMHEYSTSRDNILSNFA